MVKLEKQQVDLNHKQADQHTTLLEQQNITSRLKAQLEEQKKVDNSIKQTIATLETELRAQQLDHQTRLKEQETTKARLERMIQQQGDDTKQTLAELKTGLKKKQTEQDARLREQQEKLTKQETAHSKLEALLQDIKQKQIEQQAKTKEQQHIIKRLENQLKEKQEKSDRPQRTDASLKQDQKQEKLKEGLDRLEQELKTTNNEVTVLLREIKMKEKCLWCWIGILMVLPTLVIIIYENLQ